MSRIRWIRLFGLLGLLFGLFAGVGWYLMGGPTLFVLLHAGLAAVGLYVAGAGDSGLFSETAMHGSPPFFGRAAWCGPGCPFSAYWS